MLITILNYLKNKFEDKIIREKALKKIHLFVKKFSNNIDYKYLKDICYDKNNKILVYSIDETINNNSIVGVIIYRKILNTSIKNRYYISLLAIRKNARKLGYGSLILNEFINKYKNNKITEIVLLSLKSSVNFYIKFGFIKGTSRYLQKNFLNDCIEMKLLI